MLTNLFTVFPTVQKGQDNIFELDVNLLLTDVQANKDSYFHNINVWGRVMVTYDTDQGGQTEHIEFNPARNPSSGIFNISSEARDIWEVQAVTIVDKDGGSIVYYRDELDTAYFDIDLNVVVQPPATGTGAFSETLKSNNIELSNSNLTATKTQGVTFGSDSVYLDNKKQIISGENSKLYCEFEINNIEQNYGFVLGFIVRDGTDPSTFTSGGRPRLIGGISDRRAQISTNGDFDITGVNPSSGSYNSFVVGDRVGISIDYDGGDISFYKNGTLLGSSNNVQQLINSGDFVYFGVSLIVETGLGPGDIVTKVETPSNPPAGFTVV